MPKRHRSLATVILIAAPFTLVSAIGCKDQPAAGPATAPAAANTSMATAELEGFSFSYPANWTLTKTPDGKGINVTAARDGDWEPNVFVQVQPTQGEKAPDEELAENAAMLGATKDDYRVRNTAVVDHPAGFKHTRIEYTNTVTASDGGKVSLQQWSILIPVKKGSRVQLQAAADADVWSTYQPVFEKIVESIKVK